MPAPKPQSLNYPAPSLPPDSPPRATTPHQSAVAPDFEKLPRHRPISAVRPGPKSSRAPLCEYQYSRCPSFSPAKLTELRPPIKGTTQTHFPVVAQSLTSGCALGLAPQTQRSGLLRTLGSFFPVSRTHPCITRPAKHPQDPPRPPCATANNKPSKP
jgi:hypothetical protein